MSTPQSARLGYLDSLRLLGSAVVAAYHFLQTREANPAIRAMLESGVGTGFVVLFFIISGFVMPFAMTGKVRLPEFFIRRAFRLFPLYFASLVIVAIGGTTGALSYWSFLTTASVGEWLANVFLIWDFVGVRPFMGVSWTLSLEIIWYVVFFGAVALLGQRAATFLNIGGAVSLVALAIISIEIDRRIPLGRPAMIYASALGLKMFDYSKGESSLREMLAWTTLFLVVTSFTNYVAFSHFAHVRVTLGPVLIAWISAPLIFVAVLLSPSVRQAGWINSGIIPAMGMMSYSLYLLHPIGIEIALDYAPRAWQALTAFVATALLTYVGYRFIELPSIEIGRRIARSWRQRETKFAQA